MDWGIYTHTYQLKWPLLSASLIHSHPSCYLCAHTANSAPCTTPSPACCSQTSFKRQQAKLGFAPVMQVQIIGQRKLKIHNPNLNLPHPCSWLVLGDTHWRLSPGFFFRSKNLVLSPLSCKPTCTSCGDSCKHCTRAAPKKHCPHTSTESFDLLLANTVAKLQNSTAASFLPALPTWWQAWG